MWELDHTNYLYLLLLIPIMIGLIVWNTSWKKRKIATFGSGNYLSRLAPDASVAKPLLKSIVILFSVFFIIIGLVNPKIGTKLETIKRQGIDIVFAIDVSKSMLAEDMAPSRLAKTKQLASQVINHLGSDRIGIVGYAGSAFPMLPITTDYNMAKMYLQDMNTDMVSSMGTALSEAIHVSSDYFDDPQTSKVILLFSDGEDHGEGIEDAIEIAKAKNIKIITIGVGTEAGSQIPIKENGKIIDYKKDAEGNIVITKMNEATLKEIAQKTGGKYLYGNHTKEVVDAIDQTLETIEKTDFESQQIADFQSQFQWFLAAALCLLVLDFFLLERKTSWLQRFNLFNEK